MRRNQRGRGNRKIKVFDKEHQDRKMIQYLSFLSIGLLVLLLCITIVYQTYHYIQRKQFAKSVDAEIQQHLSEAEALAQEKNEQEKKDTTFTMTAIGDIMCHNTQYLDAYVAEADDYDFSYVFEDIYRYTKMTDITIGSLETTFAGKERGYSNYPTFNSPDNLAYDLKKIGLDVISTAGNHCLDMGFSGLSRTIDVLNDADISHLGTYQSQKDRDKILFKNVKGVRIAFVNYTYGTNGIPVPAGQEFCVNLIDKDIIKKDLENAKKDEPDIIVACMHWGTEYKTTASPEQEQLADFLFQNGVDIILGNHPHVLAPMEKRTITLEDGTQKDGFVIYALGNFICDQNAENTRNSIILNLKITKHLDGKISIDKADYIPLYMYKDTASKSRSMKLLDIEKIISKYETALHDGTEPPVSQELYQNLKVQLEKIQNIVGRDTGT